MGQFIAKFMIVWLALDIWIVGTMWYFKSTLRPMFPLWWKAHICDKAPEYFC